MNMSKTAKELFLHRSTLSARLSKIKQMISLDWNDPNDYLMLYILLKAIELNARF
jgi:purine catabolism regulator